MPHLMHELGVNTKLMWANRGKDGMHPVSQITQSLLASFTAWSVEPCGV